MSKRFGLKVTSEFEITPAGKQPAICAEVSHILAKDRFNEEKGEEHKMIISFQLLATNSKDERHVIDLEIYPQITPGNKMGKLLRSWSGKVDQLTQDQINQWIKSFFGNGQFFERDEQGEMILDEKNRPIVTGFDSWEDLIKAVDPEPPIVGALCVLDIVHQESKTSGKDYPKIVNILPNSKVDTVGNILRDPATKKPIPAFDAELDDYKPYAERQAEIQERMAKKEERGRSGAQAAKQEASSGSSSRKGGVPF